ncbi:unnamed protein product [Macrosiphum euphorbiae]|uniref:Uncharacterized protein n=1 Tax=Macrosiphum euphorbiae TaxID=13131 RepID=A0AAV0XAI7_9HEMI|nr:unnamed protein product [Macrosiphum euphorbiae]
MKTKHRSTPSWKTPSSSSRHGEVVVTRTRIGHSSRLTHLHLITKEDFPTCELCCDKELTIKHIPLKNAQSSTAPDEFSETHQQ